MLIFLIVSIIYVIIMALLISNVAVVFWGILCTMTIYFVVKKICNDEIQNKISKHLIIIYIVAMSFIVVVYFGYISQYGVPYNMPGLDDLYNDNYAKYCLTSGYYTINDMLKDQVFVYHNSKGFILFISYLMRVSNLLFGYNSIILRMINITALIVMGLLMFNYSMKKNKFSFGKNIWIVYLITLYPNALYISSHVYRDTLCALLIVICFYIWDGFFKKIFYNKLLIIMSTFLIMYISYWFRSISILYLIIAIMVNLFMSDNSIKVNTKKITGFMIGTIILIVVISFTNNNILETQSLYITKYTETIMNGNSGTNSLSLLVYSYALFPYGIILRAIYYLCSPFVLLDLVRVFHYFDNITIFLNAFVTSGTIALMIYIPFLVKNISRQNKVTIMFEVIFISIISTTMGFRHVILVYPFMFYSIITQYNLTSKKNTKKYLAVSFTYCIIGIFLLLSIKLF